MLTTVLLVLLAAAPPASEATALVQKKAWDELYLKYSAAAPGEYSEPDRALVGQALLQAARGLGSDTVLALSLAERSAAFHETSEAWLLAGELGLKLEQNAAAGKALEKAVVLDPANDRAKLLRADLAFKEGDLLLAETLYASVPEASAQRAAAQAGLERTKAARAAETERLAQLHKMENALKTRREAAEKAVESQPLTLGEVCRVHAVTTCQALKRCMPALAGGLNDCGALEGICPEGQDPAPLSRRELEACRGAIEAADCSRISIEVLSDPSRFGPECAAFSKMAGGAFAPPGP